MGGRSFLSEATAALPETPSQSKTVTSRILSSVDSAIEGESFDVFILLDLQPKWHVYWQYPGDAGFPPSVTWNLPEGWSAGPLEFSLPQQFSEPGGMIVYGYEGCALFKTRITPVKNLSPNIPWKISAKISWLACRDLCVPGSGELSITLNGDAHRSVDMCAMASSFASPTLWPQTTQPPFVVCILLQGKDRVVSFKGKEGSTYQLFPLPPAGSSAGHVAVMESANQYQMIVPWDKDIPFSALLVENDAPAIRHGWWLSSKPSKMASVGPKTLPMKSWALLLALGSGLLGGFILNLMPCVLPVISLKIFGFINQSGKSHAKILRHGLAFAAGIYLWFLALGLLIVIFKSLGVQVTWAFQFQNPGFLLTLNVIVFLFALNLFGVFEITLPGSAGSSLDELASHRGYAGSFFQGLFATLLATPCTAPFLGSALGFAFAQSGIIIMAMFFAIATGMALPYILLSAHPAWMKLLPKPGAWMEKVKQFMGFPLLATNLWLLSVLGAQRGVHGFEATVMLLFMLGISAWIYGSFLLSRRLIKGVALFLSIALAVGSLAYFVPRALEIPPDAFSKTQESKESEDLITWVPYSKKTFNKLRKEGKAIFVDFTADWCITCKFNEHTAIDTSAVRALFRKHQIVPMKADWTNANVEITKALQAFGRVGVPYYVFYPAGDDTQPVTFSEFLTESDLIKAFSMP